MAARIVQRASLHEILAFLKGQGVSLSDDAVQILKRKLDEEPVGTPTIERSRAIARNPLFMEIIDRVLVRRSDRMQKIAEKNPLAQIIDKKRKELKNRSSVEEAQMPEWLRLVFFDDMRWQPFMPFFGIPGGGQIIKIIENEHPDLPYAGFIKQESKTDMLYTTRRRIELDTLPKAKFYRLRDGTFQYEIDEIKKLDKGYFDFIMKFHNH